MGVYLLLSCVVEPQSPQSNHNKTKSNKANLKFVCECTLPFDELNFFAEKK